MATISLDIPSFRARYSEFSDDVKYPDADIQIQWDMAVCYISNNTYGRLSEACREQALYLMLAHLLRLKTMIEDGVSINHITGASEDGVSVSMQPPPSSDQYVWWLNITPYGAQFKALLSSNAVGGFYVGGSLERRGYRKIGGRF